MKRQSSRSVTLSITTIIIINLFESAVVVSSLNFTEHAELVRNSDFKQCIRLSVDFSDHFPERSNLYFLGQSLSWIGKVLEMSHFSPTIGTIQYIPFSGNFLKIEKKDNGTFFYTSRNCKLPSGYNEKKYRMLLAGLGLHPKNILSQYLDFGRRTVIADYVYSGKGLASFLYILNKWAREEKVDLSEALEVFIMRFKKQLKDFDVKILVINNDFRITPVIMDTDMYVLIRMVNPEINRNFERLLPYYPHNYWNEPLPEFDEEHQQRIKEIMKKLKEYIEELLTYENASVVVSTMLPVQNDINSDCRELIERVDQISISFEEPSTSSENFGFVTSGFECSLCKRVVKNKRSH